MALGITLIYFVYGLAFFSMGLTMLLESSREPILEKTHALLPLAFFGFLHGSHEWLEMFLNANQVWALRFPEQITVIRVVLLVISFSLLIVYDVFSLRETFVDSRLSRYLPWGGALLLFAFIILGFALLEAHPDEWEYSFDALARYILAVPGAALAGFVLFRRNTKARQEGHDKLAGSLRLAAWGFVLYSATQMVVPVADFFPASVMNTESFLTVTGVPIQAWRAVFAVLATLGLFRSTQLIAIERQRQYAKAQNEKLEALEKVRQELLEREAMRRRLLRHTVIAQEEERSRIARELHDETAQLLTAFSFHLATLNEKTPRNPDCAPQISQLNTLSRQISENLYRLVHDLRPAQLDDLGLEAALGYLAEESESRLGIKVDVTVEGLSTRLDGLVETVLYRVVQEAITNVARHAQVQQVSVHLWTDDSQISLEVSDQGVGFHPHEVLSSASGFGLAGMQERVKAVGGKLEINSHPGKGTQIQVRIPLVSGVGQEGDTGDGSEVGK